MRSLAATTYQVGFIFHAALATLAPNTAPLVAPCVPAISFPCATGRSGTKLSMTPFVVIVRYPSASGRSSGEAGWRWEVLSEVTDRFADAGSARGHVDESGHFWIGAHSAH